MSKKTIKLNLEKGKSKANTLLLVSIIIIGLTFVFSAFWETLGFSKKQTPLLAFSMIIAFGINIAGLILAYSERKKDNIKYKLGLFGNLILIIGFIAIFGYSLMTMEY